MGLLPSLHFTPRTSAQSLCVEFIFPCFYHSIHRRLNRLHPSPTWFKSPWPTSSTTALFPLRTYFSSFPGCHVGSGHCLGQLFTKPAPAMLKFNLRAMPCPILETRNAKGMQVMLAQKTLLVCHLPTFSFPNMYGDIMPLFLMIALEWASQNNCCLSISRELALSGRDHFSRADPDTLLIFLCSIRFTRCCHINFLNLLHEPSCLCWRSYSGSLWPNRWSPRSTAWGLGHIVYSATDSHTLGSLSFFSHMPLSIVSNFAHVIRPAFSLSTDSIVRPSLKLSSSALSLGQPSGLPHPNVTFAPLNSYCVYCHFLLFISVLLSSRCGVSSLRAGAAPSWIGFSRSG